MSKENSNASNTNIEQSLWMIKPCEMYKDEYKECKSIKGRFHQYYLTGEQKDCSQWKLDHDNCVLFRDKASEIAAEELLLSEENRRTARLNSAKANDVWEYRTTPPESWSAPLPDYLERMRLPEVKTGDTSGGCTIL